MNEVKKGNKMITSEEIKARLWNGALTLTESNEKEYNDSLFDESRKYLTLHFKNYNSYSFVPR